MSPVRRPSGAVLALVATAGLAAASCSIGLALDNEALDEPILRAALLDWITLPYILGGLIAWRRRPASRFGPLMIAAGFAIFLSSLQWSTDSTVQTFGRVFDLLPAVLFLHIFLAFPSGRLKGATEKIVVATGYAAAVGLQLLKMALGNAAAGQTVEDVQLVTLSALALAGIALLAARRRDSGRPLRRSVALLVDAFALGLVMLALLLAAGAFELQGFETIQRVTFGVIGLAPVAFLVGLLSARLARIALGDLVVALRSDPTPADLRDAIAQALRDPSLSLAYWLPEFGSWADLEGREIELPEPGSGSSTTVIERNGRRIAVLVHDPSLDDEREMLDAVTAAAAIALENGRLHAELKARLEELKGSRGRVIEAGQKERQRLERNLHDGAQQRLIALSLELRLLEQRVNGDPDLTVCLDHARRQIAISLEELRDVARGLHPAVVSGHGLAVALEQLAARGPVPVRLAVALNERLDEPLEVAAYYVVCESLTNIAKHARARSASVEVARDNGRVVVEVVDDGVGGADTERGSGLRGLADRVEATGGRLSVWTPRGGGTRVRAELPCG